MKGIVNHFWVGSWDETTGILNNTHYTIANRLTEITFAFNGKHHDADLVFSSIQGHTHIPKTTKVSNFYHLIGVSFNSYALNRVFDTDAKDIGKQFISIEDFLGSKGKMLNELLAAPNSTEKRIALLSNFLISILVDQVKTDHLMLSSIGDINKALGNLKIEKLANNFNLSEKQFGRRFKQFTGFSPKVYSRIVRFETAITRQFESSSLTELASNLGYFDQAHFNNEFKSFTGLNPKDFWKLNS